MPTKNEISQLHRELRGNYGSQWNPDTDVACQATLKTLLREIGPARLAETVRQCKARETFYSEEALRKHIPRAEPERKYCPRCRDSEGWLSVLIDGEKEARRVKCKHQPMEPTMRV